MADSTEQNILINSLVTLSISDQWTRCRVQDDKAQKVFGALLGKQSGRFIEILNCFEIRAFLLDNFYMIDEEYFTSRYSLFKETFPDLEFLGYYTTGDHTETDPQDVAIQKQAMKFNESPFLLKFNAENPIISEKLALGVFESVVDPADESHIIFHFLSPKIVSELAEQIGLDHVARLSNNGVFAESTASKYLLSQFGAINTLLNGITVARNYISAVKRGEIESDPAIFKDVYKLCQKLNEVKPQHLIDKETKRCSDQKLMVLLCSITNTQGALSNLILKLNILSSDRYSSLPSGHGSTPMKKHGGGGGFFSNKLFF